MGGRVMKEKKRVGVVCNSMEEVREVVLTMYPDDKSDIKKFIKDEFFPIVVFDNYGTWNFCTYKPAVTFNKWVSKFKQVYE